MGWEIVFLIGLVANFLFMMCISARITEVDHRHELSEKDMCHSFRERLATSDRFAHEERMKAIDFKYDLQRVQDKVNALPHYLWKKSEGESC